MGQAQINVRTRACSRTSIARTKQAALTHNVRGKELILVYTKIWFIQKSKLLGDNDISLHDLKLSRSPKTITETLLLEADC